MSRSHKISVDFRTLSTNSSHLIGQEQSRDVNQRSKILSVSALSKFTLKFYQRKSLERTERKNATIARRRRR